MTLEDCRIEWLNGDAGYFFRARTLESVRSEFQTIDIVDTPMLGRAMVIDGRFMTSERDEFFYHEPLVHVPAITHLAPRSALIVGGGDGGAAEEILKHPTVEQVVVAELDQTVVDLSKQYLAKIHRGCFDDPRLTLEIGDGAEFIRTTSKRFDLVILDLTDPMGPSESLYTQAFYASCRDVLSYDGVLSLHTESPVAHPKSFSRILTTLRTVFPCVRPYLAFVPLYGTLWGMATASNRADPTDLNAEDIANRIADRALIDLQFYNADMHTALFALPNFVRTLSASNKDFY